MTVVTPSPLAWSSRAIRNGSRSARWRTSWVTWRLIRPRPRAGRRPRPGPPARAGRPRSGTGRPWADPVSAATCSMIRRASSSSRIERGVERDRDDLRRRDEPGDPLVELDEPGQRGDRERRLGEMVEVVLHESRLVDHDHRLRRRAVDERQRHRRVGRVVERALALDDDPVAEPLALLDQPLDRALGEVADQPVDGDAPALDHHPGLAGRHEDGPVAGGQRRATQLERDRHLADRAVAADGQDHPLARAVAPADRRLHPIRRASEVDDRRARVPPPPQRTPGRRR